MDRETLLAAARVCDEQDALWVNSAIASVALMDCKKAILALAEPTSITQMIHDAGGDMEKVHEQLAAQSAPPPDPAGQGETPRTNKASKDYYRLLSLSGCLERELAQMARDLADANHWRERHSNDSEARGKQSHEHWLKWQAAERLVNELEAKLAEAQRDAEHQRENKNGAYLERNHLVAALARLFPSGLRRTDIPGWSADWHGCCMIDLPTGQISYHFHDSQAHLFDGLPPYKGDWDGHDKDTVHARLAALAAERKESGNG